MTPLTGTPERRARHYGTHETNGARGPYETNARGPYETNGARGARESRYGNRYEAPHEPDQHAPRPAPPVPASPPPAHALAALCRHVIGARLAVLALGIPFALRSAQPGASRTLAVTAALLSLLGSYAVLRHWERVVPLLLRHPTLLAVDLAATTVLLLVATAASPLGYAAVATPLLAALLYTRRWAVFFTALQLAILAALATPPAAPRTGVLLVAGFCLAAAVAGATLRTFVHRLLAASTTLAETRERLAVAEALAAERARLARDMHDTVAKTLHGVALAAEALSTTEDPAVVRGDAAHVARAARRAATESRVLLGGLRRRTDDPGGPVDLAPELDALLAAHTDRTATPATRSALGPAPLLAPATARTLLLVTAEALENTARHARARHVVLVYGTEPATGRLVLAVRDDGVGLPPGLPGPQELAARGHYGLLGLRERLATLPCPTRLTIGAPPRGPGTEVRAELTLPTDREEPEDHAHRSA
ncbi:Signal transduction histidine kinase [Streptomyces sp. TverLS-915]|uniref:sensor histidine kinase n=1 Tax=Streptomyces sp. TverLS-915 TaxID=1839763 RepID=UPI00081E0871|nr:histidine kinase [Streptomyces sp. TverLS-915]SCD94489.1 Signal transduction histidine kinase [Streptomyces sp. TverLS-915]